MNRLSCLLWSLAGGLSAGNVPGSWDVQIRPAQRVAGLSAAEVVQTNASVNRVLEVLKAAPGLSRSCVRLSAFVVPTAAPLMISSVAVGSCQGTGDSAVVVRVNDFAVFREREVMGPGGAPLSDAQGAFYRNPRCAPPSCLHVGRPGVPVLTPVTKEQHMAALEHAWLEIIEKAECFRDDESSDSASNENAKRTVDQARRRLESIRREARSLSAAERKSNACWLAGWAGMTSSGTGVCPPENRIMRVNPSYFDGSRRAAIQLITVENPSVGGEAQRIFDAIARSPFPALVR